MLTLGCFDEDFKMFTVSNPTAAAMLSAGTLRRCPKLVVGLNHNTTVYQYRL